MHCFEQVVGDRLCAGARLGTGIAAERNASGSVHSSRIDEKHDLRAIIGKATARELIPRVDMVCVQSTLISFAHLAR